MVAAEHAVSGGWIIPNAGRQMIMRVMILVGGHAELPKVVGALRHTEKPHGLLPTAGNNSAIKMPMIAITTNSSTSVKPRRWTALDNFGMAALLSGSRFIAERRQPTRAMTPDY